jgi:integrase
MTNPRIYKQNKPKTFENIDEEATALYRNRPILTEQEIETLLAKADQLETEYFQLRAKALIGFFKIFGKRRAELTLLEVTDLNLNGEYLEVTFTICKKFKRGFFQYLKYLKKQNSHDLLNKSLPELQEQHKVWNETTEGTKYKTVRRPKQTPVTDKYAKLIIAYLAYMAEHYPATKYVFPSGKIVFGETYVIHKDRALSGRQLLNIIKHLDPNVWLHLFRKGKGSEVARKYGRTLDSAFQVKQTLDLERTETALRYIEEFVPKLETGE